MRIMPALLCLVFCAACASVDVGEITATAPAAYLSGDPRFNAGLPVTVALRKIDDIEIGPFYSRARLAPGDHRVLVDCNVVASQSTTRFELDINAVPGQHYRLVADLAPGNQHCDVVRVDTR